MARNIIVDPIREFTDSSTPDTWAQPGYQGPVPEGIPRLTCGARPVVAFSTYQLDEAGEVIVSNAEMDIVVVKFTPWNRAGNPPLRRLRSYADRSGVRFVVGRDLLEEVSLDPGDIFVVGLVDFVPSDPAVSNTRYVIRAHANCFFAPLPV